MLVGFFQSLSQVCKVFHLCFYMILLAASICCDSEFGEATNVAPDKTSTFLRRVLCISQIHFANYASEQVGHL